MYPYYQPYQQTFQQYPQANPQINQQRNVNLNGRVVTSVEEAKAAQIDLDGSQWYFPCPSEGKIYTKSINLQGLPVFQMYEIKPIVDNSQQNVDNGQLLKTLQTRITKLEQLVKGMKQDEHDADDEPIIA